MKFPSTDDFFDEFGLEPVDVDASLALCHFIKKSEDSGLEIDISFSVVMESFQVVLRLGTRELVTISSEKVRSIELVRDRLGAGVRVVFDICEVTSEARVILEPEPSFTWWILRNS